ncbi:CubicO group peptidase (beta-lactamase class C family) [Chryseobacterium defluvii]|uniref:CubicO group peptidase (Beta-lactamase class C family) n=1 Tax=Chryseobacterium defluvii TaxID=160396 RepID=A0A840KK25_9FLAO|nr:serine hydrolase [Chryseobacterium defluvii]MBB4807212.1 CubicO group peptidase (beta-lactamase class C family) [Chryseobacterium defluvii]
MKIIRNTYSLILIFTVAFAYGQNPDKHLKGLENEIQNIINAYKAVGVSVAIVSNDKMIYSKGFGYRDYEKKLPVTSATIFPIGSNTKSFTASLIGMLQDEDRLSVKAKPSAYIPDLQFYNDRMNEVISVEDLLDHRSGIGGADGSFVLFPAASRMELLKRLPFLKPGGEPKDSWIYSNFGYIILGTIAEQITRDHWDNLVTGKIFRPLNMVNSSTSLDSMIKRDNYSLPYGVYQNQIQKILYQKPDNDKPGAAVNSTAEDMANWIRMWLNKGTFNGVRLLSEDFTNNATSMKAIMNGAAPSDPKQKNYLFGYGYGWNTKVYKGHYKVDHGGAVSGFSSNVVLFPLEKFGIVVLTNQQNTSLPYVIANMISDRMLGIDGGKPYTYEIERYDIVKPDNMIKPINNDKKPTHNLDAYCGKYNNPGYGTFEVKKEDGQLYAVFPDFRFRLEHQQYNTFLFKLTEDIPQQMNPDFELNFLIDSKGDISEVSMDIQKSTVFKKVTGK